MSFITHNLKDRLINLSCDFFPTIHKSEYRKIDFDEASEDVCHKLNLMKKNIFIGLSGGIDSEFVLKKFISLNIKVIPIIIKCECYSEETDIAFKLCEKLKVNPIVITITEKEMFLYFYENILKKFNGIGIGSVPSLIATNYALENNGIFVKSEHVVGEINNTVMVEMNEWDFYCSIQYENSYNFFMYTPEIVYSMVSKMENTSSQKFKCDLFKIPYRDKIYPNYSHKITYSYRYLVSNRNHKPNHGFFEDPQTFLKKYF